MQIELDGESYAVTTGGYESPIPSNAILDLEEAKYQSRSWKGSFSSDQVDLADIYSSNICPDSPMFTIQFGRSSDVDEDPTYQVFGEGVESLTHGTENIPEIASKVEEVFRDREKFSLHRPFIRAHSRLADGSVLYTGVYYYGRSTDSVKRFELRIFHPDVPFGVDRYDEIFDSSPVKKPPYLEEVNTKRYRVTDIPERATEVVRPIISISDSSVETVAIENPITSNNVPENAWGAFKSPNQLFAKSYLVEDEAQSAKISDFRAVSIDDLEPIFYEAEIQ
ncbi:hypothetical protein [Haloarcula sp. 1CSR25-25]|jgi:hypothetical protein|uniref:hypothetical protein n=1 Tax=Haloarcula sp. 1CSR25-25 TaxID=2862545 RepID=UPI0028957FA8|nr:hypothetical protein [Haloarcula sp. 1CSR25-25]MDT3436796.1 hypothetical protein [Haloarcula sp. 1CSR25-25]